MVVLKTSKELSDMKLSCKISAQALRLAGELIKPGVSTAYVDKMLHEFILSQGSKTDLPGLWRFSGKCLHLHQQRGNPRNPFLKNGSSRTEILSASMWALPSTATPVTMRQPLPQAASRGSAEDHGRHKGMPLQGDPGGAAWQQAGRHRARGAVLRRKLRLCGGQRLCGTWRRQETARRPSSP